MAKSYLLSPQKIQYVERNTSHQLFMVRLAVAYAVCIVVSRYEFWLLNFLNTKLPIRDKTSRGVSMVGAASLTGSGLP